MTGPKTHDRVSQGGNHSRQALSTRSLF